MSRDRLLPWEQRFRSWIDQQGMGWSRSSLPCGPDAGAAVAYRLTPKGSPRRIVIAVHGAGNDALFGWIGMFKRQLLAGSEIFTFDLPGHGRSSSTLFSPEIARTTIESAIAECAVGREGVPIHAVGFSFGGSVLLASLPTVQDRVTSAALVVAPLHIDLSLTAVLGELRPANVALVRREREHYGWTGLIPSFGPFKRDIYPLRLAGSVPPGAFGYVDALNEGLAELHLESAARAVDIPVLLAYGARDRVVPIGQGERLEGLLRRAELLRVARGTHLSTPLSPLLLDRLDGWLDGKPV